MTPTGRTLLHLRRLGFTCEPVERWIPGANIRRDLFGCIDVLAVHPRDRIILGVQATTAGNVSARLSKARTLPALFAWLRAGCLFEVWGWTQRDGRWTVRRVALRSADLAGEILCGPRPRRRRKGERQRELFA